MSDSIRKIKEVFQKNNEEAVDSGTTGFSAKKASGHDHGEIVSEDKLPANTGSDLFFGSIAKLSSWLAILLIPLIFTNISDPLGLTKQFLLLLVAFAALGAWGAKVVSAGHIAWRRDWTLVTLGVMALAALAGSFFSDSHWVSFLGDTGRFSGAGVTILAYLAIFFVAFQVFERRDARIAVILWIVSSCIAGLFGLAQMVGWFILPWAEYQSKFFNSVGSIFSLQIFVLATIPFLTAVICSAKGKLVQIGALVLILMQLIVATAVDFWVGWLGLILAIAILFFINFSKATSGQSKEGDTSFKNWPMVAFLRKNIILVGIGLVVIGVVWYFVGTLASILALAAGLIALRFWSNISVRSTVAEVTEHINTHVLSEREYQKSVIFPLVLAAIVAALWLINIPKIAGLESQSEISPSYAASIDITKNVWKQNPVFGSGLETFPYVYARFKSSVLNQTNFWGVNFNDANSEMITWITTTGILGTIAWLIFVIAFLWFAVRNLNARSYWTLGLFISWLYLLIAQMLYPASLPQSFLFWILPALFLVLAKSKTSKQYNLYYFKSGSLKTLGIFFGLLVTVLVSFVGIYYSFNRISAERLFASALLLPNEAKNRDQAIDSISRSIVANPRELRYYRILSQVLFQKMNDIMTTIQARPEAERKATAEESTQLQNLVTSAVSIIQNTLTIDPQNVTVLSDAASAFLNLSTLVDGAMDLSIQNYEKASALEPINPFLKTQLGQLYLAKSNLFNGGKGGANFDQESLDKARTTLEAALAANPNYANARYFWALILDSDGRKEEALNNFLYLQQTNPDNTLLPEIVANLKAGRPALGNPPQEATPPAPAESNNTQGIPATNPPAPAPAPQP